MALFKLSHASCQISAQIDQDLNGASTHDVQQAVFPDSAENVHHLFDLDGPSLGRRIVRSIGLLQTVDQSMQRQFAGFRASATDLPYSERNILQCEIDYAAITTVPSISATEAFKPAVKLLKEPTTEDWVTLRPLTWALYQREGSLMKLAQTLREPQYGFKIR